MTVLRQAFVESDSMTRFLDEAVAGGEKVLLLVNDGHRSTQTRATLTALAESAGGPARMPPFRAIVATGTHRFEAKERSDFEGSTFGGCGLDIEEVSWHDATDDRTLTEIAGVRLHRWLAEARFLLPIGSVEPHYFAGVTGPHKTLTIGCMSREDIERNHAYAMHPAAVGLHLQGNPVFDHIVKVLRGLEEAGKVICASGQVIRGDVVADAAVGAPLDTLDALLPTVRRVYLRCIPRAMDVLRLKVPLPLGRNLYQADKALKNNHPAVRDGGGIVLEADCPEGIGPDAFLSLLRRTTDRATALRIVEEEGYRLGDHKAVLLRHLTDPAGRGVRIALVSSHIDSRDAEVMGMKVFPAFSPAIAWLASVVTGPIERGLIVEDAGVVSVTVGAT